MQDLLRTHTWLRFFLQLLFTSGLYFLLARMSLLLQFDSSHATPVWPPAGFAFAIVLLWGNRIAPGILLGAFVANFLVFTMHETVDYPTAVWLSILIGIGHTGEALMGNYLLKKMIPDYDLISFLSRVEHILHFSITAGVMCLISSIIGTTTMYLAGIIPSTQYPLVWVTWWLGAFSGVLLVTSFILIWLAFFRNQIKPYKFTREKGVESIFLFISLILVSGIIFNNWLPYSPFQYTFWIIPLFAWVALRFEKHHTITAIFICLVIAIIGTVSQEGMFRHLPLNEGLISLQAFISIMVITKLAMNVSVIKRRQTETALRNTGLDLEQKVKSRTAQLEERNEFVETILNSSIDSIIVLDKDTRCISINKMAKSHLHLPYPENAIGKKISDLPPYVISPEVREDIFAALKGETVQRAKFASPVSERYFELDYIPIKNATDVNAVMIVAHDITQRIHAEHEIREQKAFAEMLIENSPYMIVAFNKDLKITVWNKKSEEKEGFTKSQALGKHIFELFPKYNNEQWLSTISEVLVDGKSIHYPKIQFLHRPGWGEIFITPLFNGYNEIIGLLYISNEITELVDLTSALEQNNKDLQKTNKELSSFAYVASHDLQEPLRKIQIFAKRITDSESEILSDNAKDYFNRMKNAAERMQNLIEDLLTYSRTGPLARNFENVHLDQIVEEVKEDLKDEITLKNAIIEADDLCECHVIPFQLRQLLHNLISNSIKFSKPGEAPRVVIKSNVAKGSELGNPDLDPEMEYCYITISDNGIGFDPEFNEQIFGLFQQLHGKNEYPGTGIGLSICKKIIENHYGIITAEGERGKGAVFKIYIPHKLYKK